MNLPDPLVRDSDPKRLKSVKGLMLGRVFILTLLLAIALLFQISERKYFFIPLTNAFCYYIGFFYLVTILYALSLKKISDLDRFLYFQLIVDHLFIAGLIYFTGGKESFFPLAYFFTIIGSSIFFFRRGAFFSALFSTFLYGLLLLLQLYQWVNPLGL
ncbi:MAG: hypothetical protein EHM36_10245, partial [Deltaproteobacteria bacterium]